MEDDLKFICKWKTTLFCVWLAQLYLSLSQLNPSLFYQIYPPTEQRGKHIQTGEQGPPIFLCHILFGLSKDLKFCTIVLSEKIQFHALCYTCQIVKLLLGNDKYFISATVIRLWLDLFDFLRVMLLKPFLFPAARVFTLFALQFLHTRFTLSSIY